MLKEKYYRQNNQIKWVNKSSGFNIKAMLKANL